MTILLDSCSGNHKQRQRPFFHQRDWPWLENLRAAGVAPEDVNLVLCSHLHVDHVGWNTRLENGKWVPTFPRARYLVSRPEWEYWRSPAGIASLQRTGDFITDSVLPIFLSGQAELIDGAYGISAGIRIEPAAGHTPGHFMVILEGARERSDPERRPHAPSVTASLSGLEHAILRRSGPSPGNAPPVSGRPCGQQPARFPFTLSDAGRRSNCTRARSLSLRVLQCRMIAASCPRECGASSNAMTRGKQHSWWLLDRPPSRTMTTESFVNSLIRRLQAQDRA